MVQDRWVHGTGWPDKFQPHWIWFVALVLVPFVLITLAFLGAGVGGPVPANLAASFPRLAAFLSVIGMAAALIHGRRAAIALATLGLTISVAGLLLLWWLGSATEVTR